MGKNTKTVRNEACPCGSGKKSSFAMDPSTASTAADVDLVVDQLRARQKRQEQQQGFGRPITSAMVGDQRFVAVHDKIYRSRRWQTFHDFLLWYVRIVMGEAWGDAELPKSHETRHPLLNWQEPKRRFR